jgi:hypothetical protein
MSLGVCVVAWGMLKLDGRMLKFELIQRPKVEKLEWVNVTFDHAVEDAKDVERRRLERERNEIQQRACVSLWQQAVSEVRVRHPDPRVRVEVDVERHRYEYGSVLITMNMYGMHDTGDQEKKMIDGFIHQGRPEGWPGYPVAHAYISALWSLYLMHEAQELVTFRGTRVKYSQATHRDRVGYLVREDRFAEISVIDAHSDRGANQKALMSTNNIASTLDWGLGLGEGAKLVEKHAMDASRELENEIAFLKGQVPRWE